MAATSHSNSNVTGSRKRTIKQKLDESVLKKARETLGLPLEHEGNDEDKQSEEPSLKWRKPRHNTEEGQMYIKSKEKRRLLEQGHTSKRGSLASAKKNDKRHKKNKNKKKKKKDSNETVVQTSKDPESEKRHGKEAIAYIQLWATNRDHWKFEKRKQTWLLKNCLNSKLIDEKRFELFLEYVATVKGAAREATLNEMEGIVKQKDASVKIGSGGDYESEQSDHSDHTRNDTSYERARQIIQMIVD